MEFKETSVFTRQILSLLDDDDYTTLQAVLATRPTEGKVIPGSGGIRKVRWRIAGRGKRGGLRVIYYWKGQDDMILMLYAYTKSQSEDLTRQQIKELRKLVEVEL